MIRIVAIGLLLCMAGCATQTASDERYVVDGEQFGVTDGPFRGRWWSYYERGRSFLAGGFHVEAERDFREAIAMRAADQRWARTYGLHFTREYFPNRELGVALLGLGDIDAAIESLRTSMEQTESARAGVYLEKALEKQVDARGGDNIDPEVGEVSVTTVADGGPLERVVRFVARDDHYVKSIRVAGQRVVIPVATQEHRVEQRIRLAAGADAFDIVVEDIGRNSTAQSVPVEVDIDGPVVSFDEPIVLPGVIRGAVADRSGIASLSIGGTVVEVSNGEFNLRIDEVDTTQPITYEAFDGVGNVNRGPVPVDGAVVAMDAVGKVTLASHHVTPGVRTIPLSDGSAMLLKVAQASSGPLDIEWTDIGNDTRVPMDSLVVRVRVRSKSRKAIESVSINGEACDLVPGRSSARVSRYVYLGDTVGPQTITCEVMDVDGNRAVSEIALERVLSEVEEGLPLRTVLLGAEAGLIASDESANKAEYIVRAFTRGLEDAMRARVVNRELLPHVLLEQKLSTLSEDSGVTVGEIETADMILRPFYDEDSEVLSITVEVYSTALSSDPQGAQRIETLDVAASADDREALNVLAEDLALLYQTVFPRRKGNVVSEESGRIICDLGSRDGIRELTKCAVYFTGADGDELVGDAWVRRVDEAESRAELVLSDDFPSDPLAGPVYIVTK